MKLGINYKTGHRWLLTSWINEELPASDSFTLGVDLNLTNQLITWWQGKPFWITGLWQNGNFEFTSWLSPNTFSYISNENETFFTYYYKLESTGEVWGLGRCSSSNQTACVEKLLKCWNTKDWLNVKVGYISGLTLVFDKSYSWSIYDCDMKCLNNCLCIAYGSTNDNQTGCQIWYQGASYYYSNYSFDSRSIYVHNTNKKGEAKWWIWLIISVATALILFVLFYLIPRKLRVERFTKKSRKQLETLLHELGTGKVNSSKSRETNKLKRDGNESHDQGFKNRAIQWCNGRFVPVAELTDPVTPPILCLNWNHRESTLQARNLAGTAVTVASSPAYVFDKMSEKRWLSCMWLWLKDRCKRPV